MIIHAMDKDTANVSSTRNLVEPTGLTGFRFYAERGSTTTLPYADNYLDMIVIADLKDADLASVSFDEIYRSLDQGGKAFVGR